MRKVFFCIFSLMGLLFADPTNWQQDVSNIDEEIATLEDIRTKLLGKANLLEDAAIRWQFMPDQFNESKQAYAQADSYRYQAGVVQSQIDILKQKRQRILEQHGKGS